jgi:hypothetical protein
MDEKRKREIARDMQRNMFQQAKEESNELD